jgi:hypothetical protein
MGRKAVPILLCVSLVAAAGAITPGVISAGGITPGVIVDGGVALTFGVIGHAQELGLKPGDVAPDFSLPGSDGQTYCLADFKGQRPVVLAWFPKTITKL